MIVIGLALNQYYSSKHIEIEMVPCIKKMTEHFIKLCSLVESYREKLILCNMVWEDGEMCKP